MEEGVPQEEDAVVEVLSEAPEEENREGRARENQTGSSEGRRSEAGRGQHEEQTAAGIEEDVAEKLGQAAAEKVGQAVAVKLELKKVLEFSENNKENLVGQHIHLRLGSNLRDCWAVISLNGDWLGGWRNISCHKCRRRIAKSCHHNKNLLGNTLKDKLEGNKVAGDEEVSKSDLETENEHAKLTLNEKHTLKSSKLKGELV